MPIYEFYCPDCHTIFNFFSRKIDTSKKPDCPRCGHKKIERQVSAFAQVGRHKNGGEDMPPGLDNIDESRVERAVNELASDAESLNENDPRQAASLMRKFSKMTGVEFGDGVQHALDRLESGEDPDKIESEMGGMLDGEDAFTMTGKKRRKGADSRRNTPVKRDKSLYDL